MSFRKSLFDEESVSDSDYLTTVLNLLNGYCKVNLVVPQTNLFYTSDSLLPINAKVNDNTLNNKVNTNKMNNTPDSLTHILKNALDLKNDERFEENEFQSSNNTSVDEFKIYSKPSYSDNSNNFGKKEENRRSISPKGRKKKNKYNKIDVLSTLENQTQSSSNIHKDQNMSSDYFNQYENERLEESLPSNQEQVRNNYFSSIIPNVLNIIYKVEPIYSI